MMPRSRLSSIRPLALPLLFTAGIAALTSLETVRQDTHLVRSFVAAAVTLLVWTALALVTALRRGRTLTVTIDVRKQHAIQACAQGSVLLYWGWFWSPVYEGAPLIAAQLMFAYAFDMLLNWSRRDGYTLGFGPFPVIFSINLFLWFKRDWFYLQFAMVALAFAAKEFIRWEYPSGRRAHIFNPSALALAVFSVGLILTGMSDVTRGQDIAITQFYPPHMYLWLFLIGLPGQFFFGVTLMTMSAVLTTYAGSLLYFAATGVYFFHDSFIPIAVFLGMHLLFTDPSTAPRTEFGRVVFGALYGASSMALYVLLGAAGLPTFYDKLLQVPLLNLSVPLIDRAARSMWLRPFDPARLGAALAPRLRHLAYITVWTIVFAAMSAAQGVGDDHPGQWLPFWQQACREERTGACAYLANVQTIYCNAGSGWACNEAGLLRGEFAVPGGRGDRPDTSSAFEQACRLGFLPGCHNLQTMRSVGSSFLSAPPALDDYPIILRGSKAPIDDRTPSALYARACAQGWPDACAHSSSDQRSSR